jgi:SAM-dependent methyltransferase
MNEREYHDEHYAAEAALFDSPLFRRVHDRAARQFLRATRAGRAHRILSLGCGEGSIERRLAPHVGAIVGIDLSPVAIAQAREKSAGFGNLSFQAAENLPPGPFDVVAAFAFLHHLDDQAIRETLRAARAALRPGGMFYSSDPSRRRLVAAFRGLVRQRYERHHSPDERELDPDRLAEFARAEGFEKLVAGFNDYFLGPLAWLAPATPAWLAGPLEALDNLALGIPLVRRYASSFSLCACSISSSPR